MYYKYLRLPADSTFTLAVHLPGQRHFDGTAAEHDSQPRSSLDPAEQNHQYPAESDHGSESEPECSEGEADDPAFSQSTSSKSREPRELVTRKLVPVHACAAVHFPERGDFPQVP